MSGGRGVHKVQPFSWHRIEYLAKKISKKILGKITDSQNKYMMN